MLITYTRVDTQVTDERERAPKGVGGSGTGVGIHRSVTGPGTGEGGNRAAEAL